MRTLILSKSVSRILWPGALLVLGLALACPKDGTDGISVDSSAPSSGGTTAAGGSGSAPEPDEADVHPSVLPGFSIVEPAADAGADAGTDAGVQSEVINVPSWCGRVGDEDAQLDIAIEISAAYMDQTIADCRTAGLGAALTGRQLDEFYAYVTDYTMIWFYCPLVYNVPPGGLAVFGPGNTAAIGAPATLLGADDAQLLTDYYVAAFAERVMLTSAEADALRRYVLSTASVQDGASSLLSSCETSP
jgi:hypothetical protein